MDKTFYLKRLKITGTSTTGNSQPDPDPTYVDSKNKIKQFFPIRTINEKHLQNTLKIHIKIFTVLKCTIYGVWIAAKLGLPSTAGRREDKSDDQTREPRKQEKIYIKSINKTLTNQTVMNSKQTVQHKNLLCKLL